MGAYADAIARTSTAWAPWHVVPANRKWLRNYVVSAVLVDALSGLGLTWPALDPAIQDLQIS